MSRGFNTPYNKKVQIKQNMKRAVDSGVTAAYSDKNRKKFSEVYREKIAKQDCYGCQRGGMI